MGRTVVSLRRLRAGALALLAALSACSVLPDPAPEPRYFQPSFESPRVADGGSSVPLNLRSVVAAAHLTERIAWRSGLEVGYHPGLRWSDRPARLVEVAFDHALFFSGRFQRSTERSAPRLDVTLLAFEDVVTGEPGAYVELHAVVEDPDGRVLFERRGVVNVRFEQPADAEDLAAAMGDALMGAVEQMARQLAEELAA